VSFILDALRKSERDRQAGKVPDLKSLGLEAPPKTPRWVYGLVTLLLLSNVTGLGIWFYQEGKKTGEHLAREGQHALPALPIAEPTASLKGDQPTSKEVTVIAPTPLEVPPTVPKALPPPSLTPKVPAMIEPPEPVRGSLNPSPPMNRSPARPALDEEEIDRELENESGVRGSLSGQQDPDLPRPHPGHRPGTPALRDLPAEFQSRVPDFRITMFAYAERPEERFVIINMKRLKVGDLLPGGLLLIDIEAEHLVAELDGQKFLIPRF
jgi:general secretion pathway protein B